MSVEVDVIVPGLGVAGLAAATHVIAHLESFCVNTLDTGAAYVAISRARDGVAIYTDSRAKLTEALGIRDGRGGSVCLNSPAGVVSLMAARLRLTRCPN